MAESLSLLTWRLTEPLVAVLDHCDAWPDEELREDREEAVEADPERMEKVSAGLLKRLILSETIPQPGSIRVGLGRPVSGRPYVVKWSVGQERESLRCAAEIALLLYLIVL